MPGKHSHIVRNVRVRADACWGDPRNHTDWQDLPFAVAAVGPYGSDLQSWDVYAEDIEDAALAASVASNRVYPLDRVIRLD